MTAPAAHRLTPSRVHFRGSLDVGELDALADDPKIDVLQTDEQVDATLASLLNDAFFARRPDVELRVFGGYSSGIDLSFVSRMTRLRRFAADCLQDARAVESIADIPDLEALSIGIFSLTSFDVLQTVSPKLRSLSLGQTRSKKPDLAPLSRFKELSVVYIEGHWKNIEVLSTLPELEDVTLRSVTTPDLGYLKPLRKMWSVDIKLGGIQDLSALSGMDGIKYLELWQIKGLSDVDVIGELPGVQNLFLQSLRRVESLPELRSSKALRRVTLDNMKGLKLLAALERAPALEELVVVDAAHLQPQDLLPAFRNKTLRRALVRLGSLKKNQRVKELMDEFGIAEFNRDEFRYQ
jgi:hypothetical protein